MHAQSIFDFGIDELTVVADNNKEHYSTDYSKYPSREFNRQNTSARMVFEHDSTDFRVNPAMAKLVRTAAITTGPSPSLRRSLQHLTVIRLLTISIYRGYQNLNEPDTYWQKLDGTFDAKTVINRDLREIKALLATSEFNKVRYMSDGKGNLDTSTFRIGEDVGQYISK